MRRTVLLIIGLTALGLGLRCYHYLRDPVIWHDEAALLINLDGKDFGQLWGPLHYAAAAPPLFTGAVQAAAALLGEGTFAYRLLPLLASCAALLLLVYVGRRCLAPSAAVVLALLFGCSDRLLWHGCEAKPYATDVFVTALVLGLFVRHGCGRAVTGRECLLHGLLAPVLVLSSFTACFVLGGLALALLPAARRRTGTLTALAFFVAALGGSFLVLYLGPIRAQRVQVLEAEWHHFFPHWDRPWLVPAELVVRLSEMARYACEPVGNALAPLAVLGGVRLWRGGQRHLLAVLTWPLILLSVAWLLGGYPIGPTRLVAFAAPLVLTLVAVGVAAVLQWAQAALVARPFPPLAPGARAARRLAAAAVAVLLLIPAGLACFRVAAPWPRADTHAALAILERQRRPGETVIGTAWEHTWYLRGLGAEYRPLISYPFSPEFPRPVDGDLDSLPPRCWALIRDTDRPREVAAFAEMTQGRGWAVRDRHRLRGVTLYRLERTDSPPPDRLNLRGRPPAAPPPASGPRPGSR